MKMFRSLPLVALLSLLLGAGFSGCKKEEGPVAKDPPKKRAAPVEEEPAVDPIDPQRIEQAMKTVVEPDPPEMAEEPADMKDEKADDSKAASPKDGKDEEEAPEDEKEDGMTAKTPTSGMKHIH